MKKTVGRIYKITNSINSLIYIGQTASSLETRWSGHKCQGKTKPEAHFFGRTVIELGPENFKMELLEDNVPLSEIKAKETEYIKSFNSVWPNGYNLDASSREKLPQTKEKLSKNAQGINRVSKDKYRFFGVLYNKRGYWKAEIMKDNSRYGKGFSNDTKSAIAYDKMALFLYGSDAKINFENKREKWLKQDLQKFFNSCNKKETNANRFTNGIQWWVTRGLWRAVLLLPGGKQKQVATANSREECARLKLEWIYNTPIMELVRIGFFDDNGQSWGSEKLTALKPRTSIK